MLFLVVSTPVPTEPSKMRDRREQHWAWMAPLRESGIARFNYARVGRGAVALFDVDANETLHRLLNEWAEIVPAEFQVFPLIDEGSARAFLGAQEDCSPAATE